MIHESDRSMRATTTWVACILLHNLTRAPIGEWKKCNLTSYKEIMTDRPTNKTIDQPTDGVIEKIHFQ